MGYTVNSEVLSVVSGKGGTGKTVFSAVLSELLEISKSRVLLIDLDIYVRGLTTLLYVQTGGVINIVERNELTVSDFLAEDYDDIIKNSRDIGIKTHDSRLDILPSVHSINELLKYRDLIPNSIDESKERIKHIIENVQDTYDYVIIDCRAGYDELIAASCILSDYVICIEEEDDISQITTQNLIRQLEDLDIGQNRIFRVTNKARNIDTLEELQDRTTTRYADITHIGFVPFDADIMSSFGKEDFLDNIDNTLYQYSIAAVWNNLCGKTGIQNSIKLKRYEPVVSDSVDRSLSSFSTYDRFAIVNLVTFMVVGLFLALMEKSTLYSLAKDPVRLFGIFTFTVSTIILLYYMTKKL